jgi:hypothetical protein
MVLNMAMPPATAPSTETLFRPAFLPVLDEWQAQIEAGEGPPPNLFENEDYLSGELAGYNELEAQAGAKAEEAETAGTNGDDYVRLTLLLASGLFFAGVTTSFRNRLPRLLLLIASATAIGYAFTQILVLPVVWIQSSEDHESVSSRHAASRS